MRIPFALDVNRSLRPRLAAIGFHLQAARLPGRRDTAKVTAGTSGCAFGRRGAEAREQILLVDRDKFSGAVGVNVPWLDGREGVE